MVSKLALSSSQFLALTPAGNIAEAVFSGFNAKIFADCIEMLSASTSLRVTVFPLFLQKLGEGRKAANKIQPFFLGQHQASIFRQLQRLCQQNGTCMVYNHLFFLHRPALRGRSQNRAGS